MQKSVAIVALIVGIIGCCPVIGKADLVLSFESNVRFMENSGVQELLILARSNNADQLIGLTVDFKLQGGAQFSFVPAADFNRDNIDQDTTSPSFGQIVTSGPDYTKFFSEVGFIGFNNINRSGSSLAIAPADATIANLSLEYINPQTFPVGTTPFGKLRIDTTGLTQGEYPIQITDIFASSNSSTMPRINASSLNGSFVVTAVPEPGTIAWSSILLSVGLFGRRRTKMPVV